MTYKTTPARRLAGLGVGLALVATLPAALAFGELGSVLETACATFTTCSATAFSSVGASTHYEFNNILGNYQLPTGLHAGFNDEYSNARLETTAPLAVTAGGLCANCTSDNPFLTFAAAYAQSDFGVNRANGFTSLGAVGNHTQANGSAEVRVRTQSMGYSAWRDAWTFSTSGHFNATVRADGHSLSWPSYVDFPATYTHNAYGFPSSWSYNIKVWDVDNLTLDRELGLVPTLVGAANLYELIAWNDMRWGIESLLTLDFNFTSGVQYVVIAELEVAAINGRQIDMYNTARLTDVVLSNGAALSALSGHDYLAPVPEPQTLALMLAGLLVVAWRRRTRR
jgi:hypothetical protein